MTDTYEKIKLAIENAQQIHATYKGYHREMCPHVLGLSKDGKLQCLFYQFGGKTRTGILSWKCMEVDKLVDIKLVRGQWHTTERKSGKRNSCVARVDVEVNLQDIKDIKYHDK